MATVRDLIKDAADVYTDLTTRTQPIAPEAALRIIELCFDLFIREQELIRDLQFAIANVDPTTEDPQ